MGMQVVCEHVMCAHAGCVCEHVMCVHEDCVCEAHAMSHGTMCSVRGSEFRIYLTPPHPYYPPAPPMPMHLTDRLFVAHDGQSGLQSSSSQDDREAMTRCSQLITCHVCS